METIFVQITSYRDPECQWTIQDLFEKAAHPERVFVGVCWQYEEAEDAACFTVPSPRPEQIRSIAFPPAAAQGAAWARRQAQSLAREEDYLLQIHSHTRFVEGWDDILIEMLARCPSKKPLLSTSLPGYVPPDAFPFREETRAGFSMVHDLAPPGHPQIIHLYGALVDKRAQIRSPMRSPFWIPSFLFGRMEFIREVPPDPGIFLYGENLAYSARLFTHGYDIFQPDRLVLFHWWERKSPVPLAYRDSADPRHALTLMRILHLLRQEPATDSTAIAGLESHGLGAQRSLDAFWSFAGVNLKTRTVSEYAKRGDWEEAFDRVAQAENTPNPERPRIFVQIASYRDAECLPTMRDLFAKAKHPERVRIGLCLQVDPKDPLEGFDSLPADRVRIARFDWRESQGVCWARQQTQKLWQGEEYTLSIDSHMRAAFDWDERLIVELAQCPSLKPILSNYPASYTPPHSVEKNARPTVQRAQPYSPEGDLRFNGDLLDRFPPAPLRGAFLAAGFIFARGELIREIPYDPYLYFNQEELSLAVRFYTHGWDVYSSNEVLLYHYYNMAPDPKKRPLHWDDNTEWIRVQELARMRLNHLIGYAHSTDPEVLRDLDRYGLGTARSVAEYEAFCGLDLKHHRATAKALRCLFIENLPAYMNGPIYIPELDGPTPLHQFSAPAKLPMSFPNPAASAALPYDVLPLADGRYRKLEAEPAAPPGVLILYDYIERPICDALARYADAQAFTVLDVVDAEKSSADAVATQRNEGRVTHHVEIDGMASEILSIMNDVYCRRLAPFYNVDFEWYERPQILRYPPGGKYNQHADADHWFADKKEWGRVQDRDYSVLLYLNDEYSGGEIQLVNQNYTIKPRPGMLLAFPSGHEYLHAALPTTSGIRYVIVSWAAIVGGKRVRPQPPHASVFVRQKRALPLQAGKS